MTFKYALLLPTLLVGCMSVKEAMYLPRDKTKAYEGTTCGSVPYGGWYQRLTEKSALSITASPKEGSVAMSLQILLDPNVGFQFLDTKMTISADAGPLFSVPILLYAGPRREPDVPTTKIFGTNPKRPRFAYAQIPVTAPKILSIRLPSILADGQRIDVPATEVELVERSGVMTCIQ